MGRSNRDDDDISRLVAAHHEAGHAVIHRVNGGRVKYLELHGHGGGYMQPAEHAPEDGDLLPWLAMILAGSEAGARAMTDYGYSHGHALRTNRGGDRDDLAAFRRLARGTGISEGKARRQAHKLVSRHWGRIHRLAVKLDRSGRISGFSI